jgi:RNA polymerase primary sigma factor
MRQLKITKQITNRDTASLDNYLSDIAKKEMITAEEEVVLAQKIRNGDQVALDKLVTANLRFVVSVSKQYQNQGIGLPDLINEGNLGLIKAAKRFDETRGFKFISYAVWWIRQSILQAIAEQARIVRLPLNKIGTISKVNRALSKLEQQYEREPTAFEIADVTDLRDDEVKQTLSHRGRHISMDAPLPGGDGNERTMMDTIGNSEESNPDKQLIHESLQKEIERSLNTLSSRESDVLRYFYGLNNLPSFTLEEIGEKFGLTRERVRQIKEKAIRKLKHISRNKILIKFLG